jgi:hypothetical protein
MSIAPIVLGTNGHVDPNTLDYSRRSGFCGIGYVVNIVNQDVLNVEHAIEPDPRYTEIEATIGDVLAFATHGQCGDVATSSAKVIAEGLTIGDPEFAGVANDGIALLKAIAAKDGALAVESLVATLVEDILKLIPGVAIKVLVGEAAAAAAAAVI